MGREVRMVPPNWEHPIIKDDYGRDRLQPMYDENFDDVFRQWLADFDRIRNADLTQIEQKCYPRGLADWLHDEGMPPDPAYYRPWKDGEGTWLQVWETVSEGTPVTPPFSTREELIDYLVENGDERDQLRVKKGNQSVAGWPRKNAEAFVNAGWAPSLVVMHDDRGSNIFEPRDTPESCSD